jgi:hypothetical protein
MTKGIIDRNEYDHPEHFDDLLREYRTSNRYVPTQLEDLLYELSGHRCTICYAPWLEVHHIDELSEGGKTGYDNLIVLCPNCHTRVHADKIPSKRQLRLYKRKQEIAYELPILARISRQEWDFIRAIAQKSTEDQIVYSQRIHGNINTDDQDIAIETIRKSSGCLYLQETGILSAELEGAITLADERSVSVALRVRLTSKGIKWIRYLTEADRIPPEVGDPE